MDQNNHPNEREEMANKAVQLFADGFHCSQAVLCACAELFRNEPPSPEVVAAMAPFAGGMEAVARYAVPCQAHWQPSVLRWAKQHLSRKIINRCAASAMQ